MRSDPKRYIVLQIVKWLAYALLIAVCFFAETSGSYVKPLLLIPAALCISSHTGEIQSAAVGTVCGLLLDIACGKLLGYNAVWLVICCVAVSLLHNYYLREKLLSMLILTVICTALQGYLDFVFYYAIWGHDDVALVYTHYLLPSGIMTVIASIPLYFLIGAINRRCGSHRTNELEKTVIRNNY
ncbi:MAG: rod shape-determining protein MreD [Oscillospiraceae bacterium]|nr:rod shape-determining protein MreD [Oscillospiraceae bacterium]